MASFFKKLVDQVNPFDGGKTWSNPNPTPKQAPARLPAQTVQQKVQTAKYGVLANNPQRQSQFIKSIRPENKSISTARNTLGALRDTSNIVRDKIRTNTNIVEAPDTTSAQIKQIQNDVKTGRVSKNVGAAKINAVATTGNVKANQFNNSASFNPTTTNKLGGGLINMSANRKLAPVTSGMYRSAIGTGESLAGLYDTVTPGKGNSRLGQNIRRQGEIVDRSVKQNNYNKLAYKLGQAGTDVATFMLPGGVMTKGATKAGQLASKAPVLGKAVAGVNKSAKAGNLAAKSAKYLLSPANILNTATDTAMNTGFRANRGQDINAGTLAMDAGLSTGMSAGIGLGIAGAKKAVPVGKAVGRRTIEANKVQGQNEVAASAQRRVNNMYQEANARQQRADAQGLPLNHPERKAIDALRKEADQAQMNVPDKPNRTTTQKVVDYALTRPVGMTVGGPQARYYEEAQKAGRVFEGVDGKPRFEVDDSGAKIKNPSGKTLGEVLDHPKLYEQYPELKNTPVVMQGNLKHGADATVRPLSTGGYEIGVTPDTNKSHILHETQHLIQQKEGFATGGTIGSKDTERIAAIEQQIRENTEAFPRIKDKDTRRKVADYIMELQDQKRALETEPFDNYRNLAGEAEARAVANRMNMTDGERYVMPDTSYRSTHQINNGVNIAEANVDALASQIKSKYGLTNYDQRDIAKLKKLVADPEQDVKIYRASPKNELNSGDWVTTDKTYANDIKRQNGGKVYEHTVKAKDLNLPQNIEDNPSLARFSAFQYVADTKPQSTFYDSLDVPKEDLIIKNGTGKAMSVDDPLEALRQEAKTIQATIESPYLNSLPPAQAQSKLAGYKRRLAEINKRLNGNDTALNGNKPKSNQVEPKITETEPKLNGIEQKSTETVYKITARNQQGVVKQLRDLSKKADSEGNTVLGDKLYKLADDVMYDRQYEYFGNKGYKNKLEKLVRDYNQPQGKAMSVEPKPIVSPTAVPEVVKPVKVSTTSVNPLERQVGTTARVLGDKPSLGNARQVTSQELQNNPSLSQGKQPQTVETTPTQPPKKPLSNQSSYPDDTPKLPVTGTKKVSLLDKAFRSTRSIIERQGKSGKKLAGMLQEQRDNKELWVRDIEKRIPTVQKLKNKEFENFVEATQGNAKPLNAKVETAIQEWKSVHPEIRQRGVDAGLEIGDLGENYYPHFIDYDKVFKDQNTMNKAINHLVETGQAPNQEKAIELLHYARDVSRNRQFGNLESSRIIDLPFYDRTKASLGAYLQGSADRITKTEIFGKGDEKALKLIKGIAVEGGDTEAAKNAFDVAVGAKQYNPTTSKISSGIRHYTTVTRLGLGALTNVSQNVNTGIVTGHMRTLKAIAKQLSPEVRQQAEDTGVISDAILNDLRRGFGQETFGSNRFLNAITAPGFKQVEAFNRRVAATAGRDYALRLAQKGDEATLRKLGVTGKIANNTLTDAQQRQAARKIVEKTQFKVDAQDLPGWADSPGGKLVAQFRTFSYNQGKFFSNEILKPLAKGNVAPAARLMAALPLGYALYETRRMIDGRPEEENKTKVGLQSFQKIGGAGLVLDLYQGLNPVGSKYLPSDRRASMAVGTFGGPSLGTAINAITATSEAIQRKRTPDDPSRLDGKVVAGNNGEMYTDLTPAARFGMQQIPIVGTPVMNRVLPYKKQSDADIGKTQVASSKDDLKDAKLSAQKAFGLSGKKEADIKALADSGDQKAIDYLDNVKAMAKGFSSDKQDLPKNLNSTAVKILNAGNRLTTEGKDKWESNPNNDAEVKSTLKNWLGKDVPQVTNKVAKMWAEYEKDRVEGKISKLKVNDEKQKILREAFNSQLNTDERTLYTLSETKLKDAYSRGLINDENLSKALAVERQLFEAGLIDKETLHNKLDLEARGYKSSRSSGSRSSRSSSSTTKNPVTLSMLGENPFSEIYNITASHQKQLRKLLERTRA